MRLAAALAFAAIAAPSMAQELRPFRYATNWVAQAEHGGFYQSIADGTYAACGLDVSITPGGPQVNGRALMLAGRVDGYMGGNMLQPFNALREGIPIVVVAASFQKEPQVIMTHPGVAEKFEDLKDLTLLIGDAGYQSYYQWMKAAYGFTDAQRRPYTFNSAPFLTDTQSGQQGYVTSEPYSIETEAGFAPDVWLLADYGFDSYSTTIEVTRETLEARPEDVKCFVEGSAKGWVNFLHGDNAAARAMIKADNPDMRDDQIDFAIEALTDYGIVISGDAETMGVGAMTDARMKSFYENMVKAGVIEDGLDIAKAYTLDFANTGAALPLQKTLVQN
ncbi:ABC transporter substrate-binding protein [Rubrimonas cliftonensis]|uniref:NitT/TauT family transport system substrate-binding protein n=1 Tax=Rubrimonas cliftonensis TaxID=89524 RepID=A0A1H3XLL3_9RHOB|nr:ABC transporter substrate-binding protein [Rubrimonas cliftonensis]SEA00345.1 NitT/TauT family transport system substrate-binding protein [Rubrimonas cliftonensis]